MTLLSCRCRHHFNSGFELDVAFECRERVASLFGPSGAGKTTILQCIAGLLRPDQGTITVAERLLTDSESSHHVAVHHRGVGLVFQDQLLFPHLSVQQNLRYGMKRRPHPARHIAFDRVTAVLDINHLLTRPPRNLSGGERQRVALGRALLCSPSVLLMDEPLAALDDPLKHRILTYLERVLNEWQVPTLFVSHSQAEVRRLAQEVIVLDHGRVISQGPPDEALSSPQPLAWSDTLGPTNLLRLDEVTLHEGQPLGRLGAQSLRLPPVDPIPPAPVFVEFAPGAVMLSRHDLDDLSARNQLHGHIRKVVELPQATFVAVDVGQIVWSAITPQAATELGLSHGTPVTCVIKTHSLRVLQ